MIQQGKLSELNSALDRHFDPGATVNFLCSASYESRSTSVANHLRVERVAQAFVAENENHRDLHEAVAAYLTDRFKPHSKLVYLDTSDPLTTGDALRSVINQCAASSIKDLLVDITTFTHEALLILVRLLARAMDGQRVTFVYAKAAEYSTNEPPETKWLSKGVGDVRTVLGYAGGGTPEQKLHLMVLSGFEDDRAADLIRAFEPSVISLGCADGAGQNASAAALAVERHKRLLGRWSNANVFSFPPYDPLRVKQTLKALVSNRPDHYTVIATMNTKLSTVGTAALAIEDETVQLCYAQALLYNHRHYSTPGDDFYLFRMNQLRHGL